MIIGFAVYLTFLISASYVLLLGCDDGFLGFFTTVFLGLLLYFVFVSIPIALIILIVWLSSFLIKKVKTYRSHITVVMVVVLLIIFTFIVFFTITQTYSTANRENAEKTIVALEKYKSDTGGLPRTLSELSPKYLPEIPKSPLGKEYTYSIAGSSSYTVSYSDCAWLVCVYKSDDGKWICDD